MSVPSVVAARSSGPDTMNLGRKIPGQADFIALGEAIRESAERRANRYANIEDQQRFLDQYAPLPFDRFLEIIIKYDQILIQLADEIEKSKKLKYEQARQRHSSEQFDIEYQLSNVEYEERELQDKWKIYEKIARNKGGTYQEVKIYREVEAHLYKEERRLTRERWQARSEQRLLDKKINNECQSDLSSTVQLDDGIQRIIDLGGAKRFKPDVEGYKQYLVALSPAYSDAIDELGGDVALPEAARDFHTLVVAPSGWGKSELLKQLTYHYVKHNSAAVIILDPHGDFAKQVCSWPELVNTERLVLIDPEADRGFTAGINPFDTTQFIDEEDRKAQASAWTQIIGENTSDFTANMRRVCNNCLRVLLGWDRPVSLIDLKYMLEDPEQAPKNPKPDPLAAFHGNANTNTLLSERNRRRGQLQAFAQNYPDAEIQRFFRTEFFTVSVSSTREALRNRLDTLLQIQFAEAMLTGKQTVNLRDALNAKKTVVINLAPFESDENIKVMGGLFLGMIAAIGRKRREENRADRVPVQVILDEAAMVVTPVLTRLLTQMRKFGIHVTLAQQIDGQNFTAEQRREMLACTRCKLIGDPEVVEHLGLVNRKTRPDGLTDHQFWVRWGDRSEPFQLHVHDTLTDEKHSAGPHALRQHLERGKASGLYRPNYPPPAPIETPVPAVDSAAPAVLQHPEPEPERELQAVSELALIAVPEAPAAERTPLDAPARIAPLRTKLPRPAKALKPAAPAEAKPNGRSTAKRKLFPAPDP